MKNFFNGWEVTAMCRADYAVKLYKKYDGEKGLALEILSDTVDQAVHSDLPFVEKAFARIMINLQ